MRKPSSVKRRKVKVEMYIMFPCTIAVISRKKNITSGKNPRTKMFVLGFCARSQNTYTYDFYVHIRAR